jgi:hypothetical protein
MFMAAILLAPMCADAQSSSEKDLKALFEAVQKQGAESELRGDIADRLGFGEHPLAIKDLVVNTGGVQHAVNAFSASGKSYLLFDSHLYVPEVYVFVRDVEGTFVSGFHGQQYEPITTTFDMTKGNATPVVGEEDAFWRQWLAAGAKAPAP